MSKKITPAKYIEIQQASCSVNMWYLFMTVLIVQYVKCIEQVPMIYSVPLIQNSVLAGTEYALYITGSDSLS